MGQIYSSNLAGNSIRQNLENDRNIVVDDSEEVKVNDSNTSFVSQGGMSTFYDLKSFPPEIAVSILSNLNATDLCLASCVWKELAEDESLWRRLCLSRWNYTSIYGKLKSGFIPAKFKVKPLYKTLYLLLDESTLIFAFRPSQGMQYLIDNQIIENTTAEISKFINGTSVLSSISLQQYLKERLDVLDELVNLMNFTGFSLADGLRRFFKKIHPPDQRGEFLDMLFEKFSLQYGICNPNSEFTTENISVLCYSLLLLSVDLYSPHVKNKMSKREFIRNNREVLGGDVSRDTLGDIYDDVYLNGHIVPNSRLKKASKKQPCFPFYRPYGAIFEFQSFQINLSCSC